MTEGVSLGELPLLRIHEAYTSLYGVPAAGASFNFANSLFWVDASQQSGTNGMAIATLQDNAVGARTFPVSGGSGLTFLTANRNGLPALSGAGANGVYIGSSTAAVASNQPFVAWTVAKVTSDSQIFGTDGGGNAAQFRLNYSSAAILAYLSGGFAQSNSISWADWNIILFVRDAANQIRLYNGGVLVSSPVTVSSAIDVNRLFKLYGLGFTGLFGEAGLQVGSFTNAEINSLGNTLASKWAIAWSNL